MNRRAFVALFAVLPFIRALRWPEPPPQRGVWVGDFSDRKALDALLLEAYPAHVVAESGYMAVYQPPLQGRFRGQPFHPVHQWSVTLRKP